MRFQIGRANLWNTRQQQAVQLLGIKQLELGSAVNCCSPQWFGFAITVAKVKESGCGIVCLSASCRETSVQGARLLCTNSAKRVHRKVWLHAVGLQIVHIG